MVRAWELDLSSHSASVPCLADSFGVLLQEICTGEKERGCHTVWVCVRQKPRCLVHNPQLAPCLFCTHAHSWPAALRGQTSPAPLSAGEHAVRGRMRLLRTPEDCPLEVVQLVTDCTAADPAARPSAKDLVQRLSVLCLSTLGEAAEAGNDNSAGTRPQGRGSTDGSGDAAGRAIQQPAPRVGPRGFRLPQPPASPFQAMAMQCAGGLRSVECHAPAPASPFESLQ